MAQSCDGSFKLHMDFVLEGKFLLSCSDLILRIRTPSRARSLLAYASFLLIICFYDIYIRIIVSNIEQQTMNNIVATEAPGIASRPVTDGERSGSLDHA